MLTVETLVTHILTMRQTDEEYARWSLAQYNASMPWLGLNAAVALALKETA